MCVQLARLLLHQYLYKGASEFTNKEETGHTETVSHNICWLASCFCPYTFSTWVVFSSPAQSQPKLWTSIRRAAPARGIAGITGHPVLASHRTGCCSHYLR